MTSAVFTRVRLSLQLLTEKRLVLLSIVDAGFLYMGFFAALAGTGRATDFWPAMVIMPSLLVFVPIMADAIAVERRSGTLDLALSSPGARLYFERRIVAVMALAIAQAAFVLLLGRLLSEEFPLSGPLVQSIVLTLFLGAITLNWAARLKTTGAVIFATYLTVFAFGPWVFANPIHPPNLMNGPMTTADILTWTKNNVVLLTAAAGAYAYALQRLSRPETILS